MLAPQFWYSSHFVILSMINLRDDIKIWWKKPHAPLLNNDYKHARMCYVSRSHVLESAATRTWKHLWCHYCILLFQSPSPKAVLLINARQLQKIDLVHFHQTRMSPVIPSQIFKPCSLSEDLSPFPTRRPILEGLTHPEYKYWTTVEVLRWDIGGSLPSACSFTEGFFYTQRLQFGISFQFLL